MPNKSSPHGAAVCEGTWCSGSLRQPDMLRSFADALQHLFPFNGAALIYEARACADAIDAGNIEFAQMTIDIAASEIITDLADQLDEIAGREGMRFGAHDGDGADFGFWKIEDEDA